MALDLLDYRQTKTLWPSCRNPDDLQSIGNPYR